MHLCSFRLTTKPSARHLSLPISEQPAPTITYDGRGGNNAIDTVEVTKKKFTCGICKHQFPTNNKLHKHLREVHHRGLKPTIEPDVEDSNEQTIPTWGDDGFAVSGDNIKEGKYTDFSSECSDSPSPFGYIPPQLSTNSHTWNMNARFEQLSRRGVPCTLDTFGVHGDEERIAPKTNPTVDISIPNSNQSYPYSAVHVLLLQWQEDDLGVDTVVNDLFGVFKGWYAYQSVDTFKIPPQRSFNALEVRLQVFKQQYSCEENLLIVYYASHGYLDRQNRMHWAARGLFPCPTLDWYALQVGLERTASDVLVLLDACCSAGTSNLSNEYASNRESRTEVIAASGYDQITRGQSFTTALIGELKRMANSDINFTECMSAAQLHQRLLTSMLHQTLPKEDDPGIVLTTNCLFSTPVYISLSNDYKKPSIPIKRFRRRISGHRPVLPTALREYQGM
ncbi:hypothetical protein N431DRAFT_459986 [Stipitochalara longipes BDJ]|nr:hypothetical protein N431DRAFT_459986 [Stipitochalara longipes BDJ]